ncbi:hypothetical protein [Portibacter lacus]|uniref:Uncharacterized protein n=1 Tax=Portibacter lacus TaxID=1099794 RepID=A0AA37WHL6_9BACT|nr:hypothetical protein [Portibacter lacus]GLR19574.1 hypothetical protein GCM10007940_41900 [Portibacter lacus]
MILLVLILMQVGSVYGVDREVAGTEIASVESAIGQEFVNSWSDFSKAGKRLAALDINVLTQYNKLNSANRAFVLRFSDTSPNRTLSTFLNSTNDEIVSILNQNEYFFDVMQGHKLEPPLTSMEIIRDYGLIDEVLYELPELTENADIFFRKWIDRSANILNHFGAARRGTQFGKNLATNMNQANSYVKSLLGSFLDKDLSNYQVITEVPFVVNITENTPGGFMKADIVLVKIDEIDDEIIDVIVVEAKLTDVSPYTPAQILKFTAVKEAADGAKIPFELKFPNDDIGQVGYVLDVPKENVVRITAKNSDDVLAESIKLDNIDLIKNVIVE